MKKVILNIITLLTGIGIGTIVTGKTKEKKVYEMRNMSDKHLSLFLLMNQWVKLKQKGKNLAGFFERNGYNKVAIYGMSYVGETLVEELQGSNINIKYGIDKRGGDICSEITIISPDDEMEEIDVIVVTSITFFDEIKDNLRKKVNCPIVSLESVLFDVAYK